MVWAWTWFVAFDGFWSFSGRVNSDDLWVCASVFKLKVTISSFHLPWSEKCLPGICSCKAPEFQVQVANNIGIFHIWINSLRKAHPQDVVVLPFWVHGVNGLQFFWISYPFLIWNRAWYVGVITRFERHHFRVITMTYLNPRSAPPNHDITGLWWSELNQKMRPLP